MWLVLTNTGTKEKHYLHCGKVWVSECNNTFKIEVPTEDLTAGEYHYVLYNTLEDKIQDYISIGLLRYDNPDKEINLYYDRENTNNAVYESDNYLAYTEIEHCR